jgi:hypothetical protein
MASRVASMATSCRAWWRSSIRPTALVVTQGPPHARTGANISWGAPTNVLTAIPWGTGGALASENGGKPEITANSRCAASR